jgi:geranylgeranyl pyrophosphate synthase
VTAEQRHRDTFERALAAHVDERYPEADLVGAVARYVLTAGGKRVRPVLAMLAAEAAGAPAEAALPAALALEMVHTYSLVHDDLPCMDDDDLRRGRPTAHKVYGEAPALLAGDALLTDAFTVLAGAPASDGIRIGLVRELASAAGGAGMVLGQALDLHWTARSGATQKDLDAIHLRKTGYLLGAAAAMGALAGGAGPDAVDAFRSFGRLIGLAFQVQDDLLDDTAATGKSQGKDQRAGKLTYLARMSRADAARAAQAFTDEARAALAGRSLMTPELERFVTALLDRRS